MKFYFMAVILVFAVLFACTATEERLPVGSLTQAPFFENFDSASAESAKLDRPILIDFYTDW